MTDDELEVVRRVVTEAVAAALAERAPGPALADLESRAARAPRSRAGLLTLDQAGELVHAAPETIRHWIWEGRLKAYKPGRAVLVREADLLKLVDENETVAKRVARRRRES